MKKIISGIVSGAISLMFGLVIVSMFFLMPAGCVTGGSVPVVNPTVEKDITAAGQVVGGLAKTFLPLAGAGGAGISSAISLLCAIKAPASVTAASELDFFNQIEGQVQQIWTGLNALNTAEAQEVLLAVNTAWGLVETEIPVVTTSSAVQVSVIALDYLEALVTGICNGFNGTLSVVKQETFWQKVGDKFKAVGADVKAVFKKLF